MVKVNRESDTNGDRWMMEKIMSDPCTVTIPPSKTCTTGTRSQSLWVSIIEDDATAGVTFGPGRVKCRLHSSSRVLVNSQELDPGASRDVVTVLFPHHSVLLFIHTHRLLTWRGRHHYINTSFLFIHTLSSFCFFDLSMDLANS